MPSHGILETCIHCSRTRKQKRKFWGQCWCWWGKIRKYRSIKFFWGACQFISWTRNKESGTDLGVPQYWEYTSGQVIICNFSGNILRNRARNDVNSKWREFKVTNRSPHRLHYIFLKLIYFAFLWEAILSNNWSIKKLFCYRKGGASWMRIN